MEMKAFLAKFGLSRADVENWLSRPSVQLRTKYAPTVKGRARKFTKENVMELALVGALVEGGVRASDAAMWAEPVIEDHISVLRKPNWIAFPAQSFNQMISAKVISTKEIEKLSDLSPNASVFILHVGRIFQPVAELFKLHSEDE